jgi:Flavodoxins
MDSVIYCFSSTGNSLKVAKDLAYNMDNTKLIKICRDSMNESDCRTYKRVGIIFPVYYYGMPVIVREFVENMEFSANSYVYAVATCGGSVGAAIRKLKNILKKRK